MTRVLYRCDGCNTDQSIPCAAVDVSRPQGRWWAECVCPDCGVLAVIAVDDGLAARLIYAQTADRLDAAVRAARCAGQVTAEAEQIVKEAARG